MAYQALRKTHRVVAALFLLAVVPAFIASSRGGDEPSPLVYLPLVPLALLTITGTYLLVRPWVLRARARKAPGGAADEP